MRILIAEDDEVLSDGLCHSMRQSGYAVDCVKDGHSANLILSGEQPFDLVILDLGLPKVDGFTLVYRLRSNPETQAIPVIFLSATYIAPEDKDFALTIGATRFLEKPINNDELLRTINELLTKGINPPTRPAIKEREFLKSYRERLEIKLGQKSAQISRTERLIETLPAEQKPGFLATLKQSVLDRENIRAELDRVREFLAKFDTPA